MSERISLGAICDLIAERIGPCPKCSKVPAVVAVFENNESAEIIGFRVICECNTPDGKISQEQITALPVYSMDELEKMFRD